MNIYKSTTEGSWKQIVERETELEPLVLPDFSAMNTNERKAWLASIADRHADLEIDVAANTAASLNGIYNSCKSKIYDNTSTDIYALKKVYCIIKEGVVDVNIEYSLNGENKKAKF